MGLSREQLFLLLTIVILVIFGAVLEGAPALIFAPILVPIAVQLGFSPLHFGIIMIMAMGFGLFSPPIGLGLYTTCAICGVEMKHVIRPMAKYLAVVFVGIIIVAMVPPLACMVAGARWLLILNPVVNRTPLFKHG